MIDFFDAERVTRHLTDLEDLLMLCHETGSTFALPRSFYTEKLLGLCNYLKEGKAFFLVAMDEEEVAGFLWAYEIQRDLSSVMHVSYFVVSEKYRKKGHGKALMDAVESLARDLGINTMELNVKATNKYAINYYTKCNFQAEHITLTKKLH